MHTLYHSQMTGNSYKVRLLLSMLGLSYEAVDVDIFNGQNRSPWYLKINPLGKVPALRLEEGHVLTESNAILTYLADETCYLPLDLFLRTKVLQWMFFEQYSHLPYVAVARFYIHLLKKSPPRQGDHEVWLERGNIALKIMDEHLARRDWLVEHFTIADICLYAYTHVAEDGGFRLAQYPAICDWLRRVEAQPRYVAIATPPAIRRASGA